MLNGVDCSVLVVSCPWRDLEIYCSFIPTNELVGYFQPSQMGLTRVAREFIPGDKNNDIFESPVRTNGFCILKLYWRCIYQPSLAGLGNLLPFYTHQWIGGLFSIVPDGTEQFNAPFTYFRFSKQVNAPGKILQRTQEQSVRTSVHQFPIVFRIE